MYGQSIDLESRPDEDQRRRLNDFLREVTFLSRKYRLLLDPYTDTGVMAVLDMDRDTIVGLDVGYLVTDDDSGQAQVLVYDCAASIHDGDWIVTTPEGDKEQRDVNGSAALLLRRRTGHFPQEMRSVDLTGTAAKSLQRGQA